MSADDDKLLDDYLAGDSELSRRYREQSGDQAPPAAVDERLRAAARREVRAGPRGSGLLPAAWTRPLAAAAVIVLAVGVVLQVVRDDERVNFDEVESTLKHDARRQSGDSETGERQRGMALPQAGQAEPQSFKYQYIPPGEPESHKPFEQPAQSDSIVELPQQRARDAAPDSVPGDTREPKGPERVDDPQAWLDHIRRLADRGEIAAARTQLDRYHDRFPARPVPKDLRELLDRRSAAPKP